MLFLKQTSDYVGEKNLKKLWINEIVPRAIWDFKFLKNIRTLYSQKFGKTYPGLLMKVSHVKNKNSDATQKKVRKSEGCFLVHLCRENHFWRFLHLSRDDKVAFDATFSFFRRRRLRRW